MNKHILKKTACARPIGRRRAARHLTSRTPLRKLDL
jgi:hypothetical protein